MRTRRNFLISAAALPLATPLATQAASNTKSSILTYGGAAIGGYDPVAYFLTSGPQLGEEAHSVEWKDGTFLFSSAANKKTFEADPEKFAPRYGGYCSYAAALNYVAPTSSNAWSVYEDRLYLNFNLHVRSVWEQDKPGYIAKADVNWPGPLQA
ncbi:MAG: YHS domain-containing (seleno)protein [Pseudomonadota bacterium]